VPTYEKDRQFLDFPGPDQPRKPLIEIDGTLVQ
jgi:hypothetical protein